MTDGFLGDDRAQALADPGRGPVEGVSSLVPELPVPISPTARYGTVATVCPLLPRLALPAVRLITLIWALILWQAMTAESLAAQKEARPSGGPVAVKTGAQPTQSSPVARSAKIRRHGWKSVAPHFPRPHLDDPTDDETSDDPTDDDDNWEDVSADDNTNELVIAWFPALVRYLTAHEVGSSPALTETPSSPFPTPRRLRC
jgi:cytoskeletal protein RodZ